MRQFVHSWGQLFQLLQLWLRFVFAVIRIIRLELAKLTVIIWKLCDGVFRLASWQRKRDKGVERRMGRGGEMDERINRREDREGGMVGVTKME